MRFRTRSETATAELAAALSHLVMPGDLILLAGDLGAGKTVFAKGFGAALGVVGPITSPTFTLVREYRGRIGMYHLDVYRLGQLDEVEDLGLAELLDDDAVTLIEWGDVISPVLHPDYLEVRIERVDGDDVDENHRELELRCVGTRWSARRRVLLEQLAAWVAESPAEG